MNDIISILKLFLIIFITLIISCIFIAGIALIIITDSVIDYLNRKNNDHI